MQDSYTLLIPSAGVGRRFGAEVPKQYIKLNGKTIARHTIDALRTHPSVGRVIVAISKDDNYWQPIDGVRTCIGGAERVDSVIALLQAASAAGVAANDWVLVHDIVRPCVGFADLDALFLRLRDLSGLFDGAILGFQAIDSLKQVENDRIIGNIDRGLVAHAATPQAFRLSPLLSALNRAKSKELKVTDEATAMLEMGGDVRIVPCSSNNIKLTTVDQLSIVELSLADKR